MRYKDGTAVRSAHWPGDPFDDPGFAECFFCGTTFMSDMDHSATAIFKLLCEHLEEHHLDELHPVDVQKFESSDRAVELASKPHSLLPKEIRATKHERMTQDMHNERLRRGQLKANLIIAAIVFMVI